MQSGFEIIVNGVSRSFRDRRDAAHQAGIYLKTRNPGDIVQIRDGETQQVVNVMQDGRLG